jgi:hypothetical protein
VVAHWLEDPQDHDQLIDLTRTPRQGDPPVPGAQWDELHERWEHWDDAAEAWTIVGDATGAPVLPPHENPIPAFLARELLHADEVEEEVIHIIDVDRLAAPAQPVPGAQWNEVVGRWERWDEAADGWVEAVTSA